MQVLRLLPPHVQAHAPVIYFGHPFCHVKVSILFDTLVMIKPLAGLPSIYFGTVVVSAVGRELLVKRFTVVPQHGPLGLQQLPRQLPNSGAILILVICAMLAWKAQINKAIGSLTTIITTLQFQGQMVKKQKKP
jgi:hypothetical protein